MLDFSPQISRGVGIISCRHLLSRFLRLEHPWSKDIPVYPSAHPPTLQITQAAQIFTRLWQPLWKGPNLIVVSREGASLLWVITNASGEDPSKTTPSSTHVYKIPTIHKAMIWILKLTVFLFTKIALSQWVSLKHWPRTSCCF